MQKVARSRTYFAPGAVGIAVLRLHYLFMGIYYFVELIGYLIVSIVIFIAYAIGKALQIIYQIVISVRNVGVIMIKRLIIVL